MTEPREEPGPAGGPVTADRYRELMSRFPTGVSVVTSVDAAGRPWGATCSSLCSVTLTPPTLLCCLRTDGRTLAAVLASGRFAVNLLRAEARHAATVFAAPSGDRFTEVPWRPWRPSGLPHLHRDAVAVAECRVSGRVAVGDHVVVMGAVAGVELAAGLPLVYGMREFSSWSPPGGGAARPETAG
ncbi:flavin reductase family protein [Streptomyces sp. URMC 129]|uniref:flavin reductase family protein n=1 Tax=Streptomyces sp. URMC 129 TaxID=3423407 RepID=UPI003F1D6999